MHYATVPLTYVVWKQLLFGGYNKRNIIYFADYDTNKTVKCSSQYVYDESRQRSLQHFIEFEELPERDKSVVLPSGTDAI